MGLTKKGLTKLFKPIDQVISGHDHLIQGFVDRNDGAYYEYHDPRIEMAINVAMATNRPLLVQGPSGCGKSSLAFNVAKQLDARFFKFVVHSRARARDLLWRFDAVRRLGDAQAFQGNEEEGRRFDSCFPYIQPGVLWWAFDQESATRRGAPSDQTVKEIKVPMAEWNQKLDPFTRAVILIDEIDKADPDFANDLLVPLGSYEFLVEETQTLVKQEIPDDEAAKRRTWEWAPLVIITTNLERRLPDAFIRRCLSLKLGFPEMKILDEIAQKTLGNELGKAASYQALKTKLNDAKHQCSIAEFIDLARACQALDVGSKDLEVLLNLVLNKDQG